MTKYLMKTLLACCSVLALTACSRGTEEAASAPSAESRDGLNRPNIVLIIADDLGWNDIGAYGLEGVETPNIDNLATQGVKFELAFLAASSCSPSRASIITGRYPHNTGAEQLHWPLPADSSTFVQYLGDAGYYTAAAGKWHLGDDIRHHFDDIFDKSAANRSISNDSETATVEVANDVPINDGSGAQAWVSTLRDRPRDKPFFVWFAADDPHRPYVGGTLSSPTRSEQITVPPSLPDTVVVRQDLALYFDEVRRLDAYVGAVLAELKAQDVFDNTVVLFISDNGRPFPRAKGTLYDDGVRTPLIVSWPSVVSGNTRSESLVSTVDIAPTLLELAGVSPIPQLDGHSFSQIIADPSLQIRDYAFSERAWHDYEDHIRSVRSSCCRLVVNSYRDLPLTPPADAMTSPTFAEIRRLRDAGALTDVQSRIFDSPRQSEEFYDLRQDPDEFTNLIDDARYKDLINQHRRALQDWSLATNDYQPSVRTPDEFSRETGEPLPNRRFPRPSKLDTYGTSGEY